METTTWRASSDWGLTLGYDDRALRAVNERAAAFLLDLRQSDAAGTVVVSGCIGPRGDAYSDTGPASANEALSYHRVQAEVLAGAGVDLLTALTLALRRVRGVRANASRRSHAELDNSAELDDGDPIEFGRQLAELRAACEHINVLGGAVEPTSATSPPSPPSPPPTDRLHAAWAQPTGRARGAPSG